MARFATDGAVNTPNHIAAACRRALLWVRDGRLREQLKQHIERMEDR